MLSKRHSTVLNLVAQGYINTARPVPSVWVANRLGFSSATVRNDFSVLEEQGLLQQQHVSSGRVPTSAGLSAYARGFIPPGRLPQRQRTLILRRLGRSHGDSLLQGVAELASELSGYAVSVSLLGDSRLETLQIHLSELAACRVLAVVILENGLVRQRVLTVDPAPSENELAEAADTVRLLRVPLRSLAEAARALASTRADGVGRILLHLAAASTDLMPVRHYSHGLANLFQEPEAQDPEFIRLALSLVESPEVPLEHPGPESLRLLLDDATASVQASLKLGHLNASLSVIGPARMRFRETLRVADGIATALAGTHGADTPA